MSSLIEDEKICLATGGAIRRPLFIESMSEAVDPGSGCRIRVWRKIDSIPEETDLQVQLALSKIPGGASIQQIFDIISSVPDVTAAEFVDNNHNGFVAYFEW